jgi:hypothetical protein
MSRYERRAGIACLAGRHSIRREAAGDTQNSSEQEIGLRTHLWSQNRGRELCRGKAESKVERKDD